MPEKKVSTPAADAPAAEGKTRKSTKAPARRGAHHPRRRDQPHAAGTRAVCRDGR